MLLKDLGQIRHDFLIDIRRKVDERTVRTVIRQFIVGEAAALERVRKLSARDMDIDLLGKGIAHGIPLDLDSGITLKLIQDFIVLVAGRESGLPAHDLEFLLVSIHIRLPGFSAGRAAAACCERNCHSSDQGESCDFFHFFHFHYLLV